MTLYRMYSDNGNRAGFWVQHRSWGNICAQVRSLSGQECGRLVDQANVDVVVQGFDVRSGRPVELGHGFAMPTDRNFRVIAEPGWFRRQPELSAFRKAVR